MHAPAAPNINLKRRQATHRRWLVPGLVIVAIAGAALYVHRTLAADGETAVTEIIIRRALEETVTATGKIQPRAYVDVGAQASGQLQRILVQVGDVVQQGQLLAEIDPQVQAAKVDADEAQLAQYNANLVEQEANVEFARATLGRHAKLVADNGISKMTFDERTRDVRTSAAKADAIRAQIKQMESTLKADQVALGYTKIYAPMAGTVVSIDAREGQTLNAAYSTPQIMRIADLATMTVWTQVSEADVTRLKNGMPVYFTTLGHDDRRWNATLRQILPAPARPERSSGQTDTNAATPSSTNNVVLYTALFDVDNAGGKLRPEMTAQVSFVVASVKGGIIAPVVALRFADKDKHAATITVVDAGGQESQRDVKVGLRTRFEAEILSGLAPGDKVVIGRKPNSGEASLVRFRL